VVRHVAHVGVQVGDPSILKLTPQRKPYNLDPKLWNSNPGPYALNPKPLTLNPKP